MLDARLRLPTLLRLISDQPGLGGTITSALRGLEQAAARNTALVSLREILSLDTTEGLALGARSFDLDIKALNLISTAAAIANGSRQISLDLNAALPGLARVELSLGIGTPPLTAPSYRIGLPGTAVRTAQTG